MKVILQHRIICPYIYDRVMHLKKCLLKESYRRNDAFSLQLKFGYLVKIISKHFVFETSLPVNSTAPCDLYIYTKHIILVNEQYFYINKKIACIIEWLNLICQ